MTLTLAGSTGAGPLVRAAVGRGYFFAVTSSVRQLYRFDSVASATLLQDFGGAGANGDLLRIAAKGSIVRCSVNGGPIGTDQSDATYASGSPALNAYDNASGWVLDDFVAGNIELWLVSRSAKTTSGTPTTVLDAITHTAGNLLVVGVGRQSTNALTGIENTALDGFSKIPGSEAAAGPNNLELWYAKNINGHASDVVTVTWNSANNFENVVVYEFSGAELVAPFDNQSVGTGSGTAVATGSIGVSASEDVIVAFMLLADGAAGASGGAGYAFDKTNFSQLYAGEYKIVTAAEAATATQGNSNLWAITGASFKVASAAAPRRFLLVRR